MKIKTYNKLEKIANEPTSDMSAADLLAQKQKEFEAHKGTAKFWDRYGSKLVGTGLGGLTTAAIAKLFGASNTAAALWALPGMGIGYVSGAAASDRATKTRAIAKANKIYRRYVESKINDTGWDFSNDKELERLATDFESKAKSYYDKYGYADYSKLLKVLQNIK